MDPKNLATTSAMRDGFPNDPRKLAKYTNKSFLFCEFEGLTKTLPAMYSLYNLPQPQTTSPGRPGLPALRPSVPEDQLLLPVRRVDISTLVKNTGKILEGKYFFCRTLAPPIKMTAIMTIVEDPRGQQGIRLAVYNSSASDKQKSDAFFHGLHVGKILTIRNPCFRPSQDGGFSLQCEDPEDVVFISEPVFQAFCSGVKWEGEIPRKWQKLIECPPQSVIGRRNEGNKLFVDQNYQKAIKCYTEGLNLKDVAGAGRDADVTVMCEMLSNRAAAYLRLDCSGNALEDVNRVLEIDPNHIKGFYRKGKALVGLQRFGEAIEILTAAGTLKNMELRSQKLFTELLKLTRSLLKQQKTGEYDIFKLYNDGEVRHNDCADYVGPVKVQQIDGKGRGLVATQDIQPGQLISATKAFVVIFPEQPDQGEQIEDEFILNFQSNLSKTVGQQKLIQKIAQKLTLDPSLCREVYQLYAGPDMPIYDEGIEKGDGDHMVDMQRIDAICSFNIFGGRVRIGHDPSSEDGTSVGLWIFPSFYNHSCWDANALWRDFGDMLFVRAIKKIHKGEEIVIPYQGAIELYENREKFMMTRGFVCQCRLCQIDRDDSVEGRKRMELLEKIHKYWTNEYARKDDDGDGDGNEEYDFMLSCLKNVWDLAREGQTPNLKLNPTLAYPMIDLAKYCVDPKNPKFKTSIDLVTKCYNLTINSPLKKLAIESCLDLIGLHFIKRNRKKVYKWIATLKKEVMIFYGTLDMVRVVAKDSLVTLEQYNITL